MIDISVFTRRPTTHFFCCENRRAIYLNYLKLLCFIYINGKFNIKVNLNIFLHARLPVDENGIKKVVLVWSTPYVIILSQYFVDDLQTNAIWTTLNIQLIVCDIHLLILSNVSLASLLHLQIIFLSLCSGHFVSCYVSMKKLPLL